ncbi:Rv3235 family protein [uncultured Corynebacterium sp.]|uniref:Rv3235 family protein n=1 Tax=uncultured Corynebacterium sp. TaxID=159447 RepID=UPI0025FE07A9|nr:Rv3235 family protein [uncultured Corynebacterium sp.]
MNSALNAVATGAITTVLGPHAATTPGDTTTPPSVRHVHEPDWLNPIPGFTLLHHLNSHAALDTSGDMNNPPAQTVRLDPRPSETTYSPISLATPTAVIRRLVTIALETASGHRPPSKLSPNDFAPVVRQSLTTLSRLSSSPHAPVAAGRLIMVHCSTNEVEGERPRFVEFCGTWQARLPQAHQPGRVRILAGKAAKSRTSYRVTTLRFM